MKEIDAILDHKPTKALVIEIAKLRINNLDSFRELQALNDTRDFLYIHPLIKHFSLRSKLEELLKHNAEEFLNSYARAKENVKRYSSFVKSEKRKPDQKKKDRESLTKWTEECEVYKSILESKNK